MALKLGLKKGLAYRRNFQEDMQSVSLAFEIQQKKIAEARENAKFFYEREKRGQPSNEYNRQRMQKEQDEYADAKGKLFLKYGDGYKTNDDFWREYNDLTTKYQNSPVLQEQMAYNEEKQKFFEFLNENPDKANDPYYIELANKFKEYEDANYDEVGYVPPPKFEIDNRPNLLEEIQRYKTELGVNVLRPVQEGRVVTDKIDEELLNIAANLFMEENKDLVQSALNSNSILAAKYKNNPNGYIRDLWRVTTKEEAGKVISAGRSSSSSNQLSNVPTKPEDTVFYTDIVEPLFSGGLTGNGYDLTSFTVKKGDPFSNDITKAIKVGDDWIILPKEIVYTNINSDQAILDGPEKAPYVKSTVSINQSAYDKIIKIHPEIEPYFSKNSDDEIVTETNTFTGSSGNQSSQSNTTTKSKNVTYNLDIFTPMTFSVSSINEFYSNNGYSVTEKREQGQQTKNVVNVVQEFLSETGLETEPVKKKEKKKEPSSKKEEKQDSPGFKIPVTMPESDTQ